MGEVTKQFKTIGLRFDVSKDLHINKEAVISYTIRQSMNY